MAATKRLAKDAEEQATPQETPAPAEWGITSFRLKWIDGYGAGRSHPVATEAEAMEMVSAIRQLFPKARLFVLEATKQKEVKP